MALKYKAIIFDLDDTLIKTVAIKFKQHKAFAKHTYNLTLTDEILKLHWGKPFHQFMVDIYGHIDSVGEVEAKYFPWSHKFPPELEEKTVTTLAWLRKHSLPLSIVTSCSRDIITADLMPLSFPLDWFFKIQTSDDTSAHKPDPAVFWPTLSALVDIGVRDRIVYIGDAISDYHAAKGAGLDFIGITSGLVGRDEFKQVGAENVVEKLEDLIYHVLE
jgi:phosphoglycolate phosphatase-like HAD superfamily hydrolase